MVGGYGKLGAPFTLVEALSKTSVKDLTVVCGIAACNQNMGLFQELLSQKRIKKFITSDIMDNSVIIDLFKKGEIEIQLEPLGTLAEKVRAGGYGIPGFYTSIGLGTFIEEGGIPSKLASNGKTILSVNLAKQKRMFNGKECLFEKTLSGDFSLVKAWKADPKGNCAFRLGNRNISPDMAIAGKICIVEAEEILETGAIDGDDVHLSGLFVHKVVQSAPKTIEGGCMVQACPLGSGDAKQKRELIVKRAAQEIKEGNYVVLGNGLPKAVEYFIKPDLDVHFVVPETGLVGAQCQGAEEKKGCIGDLLDGAFKPMKLRKNGAVVRCSDGFAGIRGQHMHLTIINGFQVSQDGDLANIERGDKVLPSPGANIDLACSGNPLVVLMEMTTNGKPNLVKQCEYKVSGRKCVNKLITDMGVFEFKAGKLILTEVAPGVSPSDVKAKTPCSFEIAPDVKQMK